MKLKQLKQHKTKTAPLCTLLSLVGWLLPACPQIIQRLGHLQYHTLKPTADLHLELRTGRSCDSIT